MKKIRIGIVGYGNLGQGVEKAIQQNEDMQLVGVFSRRNPESITLNTPGVRAYQIDDAFSMKDQIDVMILCGGSATDLPEQGPQFSQYFHTIDSFDTHANIPDYFASMDAAAQKNGKVSIISVGWDPGLFSLNRLYAQSILPKGQTDTFWGKGVSQGHSDAIRRVAGVKNAVQYTVPMEQAVESVRNAEYPALTAKQKHLRECFVVAEEDADRGAIEQAITTMPNYFADYNTVVHFITEEELQKNHSAMPHGGFVIRCGKTGWEENHHQRMEFSLQLESNAEFTSSVLIAYARAAYRLAGEGISGAKTVLDIAPTYLSLKTDAELRKELL